MDIDTTIRDLTAEEYELFRRLVYDKSGINLGGQKQQLVRARLGKRLRQGGFPSYRAYYEFVERDPTGEELAALLDSISTNTTHLFREMRHFDLLHQIVSRWAADKAWRRENDTLRIWSAGCSSGEEPYSIAMTVHDALAATSGPAVKILASDLSTKVLAVAQQGVFDAHRVGTVPPQYKRRYLHQLRGDGQPMLQVTPEIQQMITFTRFNLMRPQYPFRHGFHVIFCRNVMIYFDRPTQEALVHKYTEHMRSGGYLMIGHSESLNAVQHSLAYVEPTVYQKR